MHHGDVMGPWRLTIQITRRASRDIGEDRADLPKILPKIFKLLDVGAMH